MRNCCARERGLYAQHWSLQERPGEAVMVLKWVKALRHRIEKPSSDPLSRGIRLSCPPRRRSSKLRLLPIIWRSCRRYAAFSRRRGCGPIWSHRYRRSRARGRFSRRSKWKVIQAIDAERSADSRSDGGTVRAGISSSNWSGLKRKRTKSHRDRRWIRFVRRPCGAALHWAPSNPGISCRRRKSPGPDEVPRRRLSFERGACIGGRLCAAFRGGEQPVGFK